MSKMWRPENWERQRSWDGQVIYGDYEAVADAMLEALRKEPDSKYIVNYGGKGMLEHPNGWLCFIPDE